MRELAIVALMISVVLVVVNCFVLQDWIQWAAIVLFGFGTITLAATDVTPKYGPVYHINKNLDILK